PPGSFSWINTRVVEQTSSNPHVVSAAFIRVGSRVVNQEPIVERFKVAAGTIVAVIGRAEPGRDGPWLPIRPVPSEVRYIPAEAAPSQYCYLQDSNYTARLAPPLLPSPNPPPGRPEQWCEPGRLWPTAFFVDGKRAYRLEPVSGNKMWMYVTAGGNVNLDPYVGRVISVYGSTMYRGDLRTNYMAAVQVSPVNHVR